jgi:aryl-alcohol dehydrogenase-like predicted oxidoreductase
VQSGFAIHQVLRRAHTVHPNLRIVDTVQTVATEAGATRAQVALAWLLTQGHDIMPIPGADPRAGGPPRRDRATCG